MREETLYELETPYRQKFKIRGFRFEKPLTTEHEVAFKVIRRLHGGCL